MAQKNTKLIIDEQSKEYWKWRDSILAYEELMLEALTFDLLVDNPYIRLHDYMGRLELLHNKTLRDSAWAFCNVRQRYIFPMAANQVSWSRRSASYRRLKSGCSAWARAS